MIPIRQACHERSSTLDAEPAALIIAGYAGRDQDAVRAHIAELAEIGVPPPPRTPFFYEMSPALLTTAGLITVPGPATSGEVEPVLVRRQGRYFLGVGSDHTDRDLEKADVAASKAAVPKPLCPEILPIELADGAWDQIELASRVDGEPYQHGTLAGLLPRAALLAELAQSGLEPDADMVMFCGTLPLDGGAFVYGREWQLSLAVPGGPRLSHRYVTTVGPQSAAAR